MQDSRHRADALVNGIVCKHRAAVMWLSHSAVLFPRLAVLQTLDKHTNLATVLLGQIKARALDQYNSVAEDLLCGKGDRGAVLKLLQGGKGSAGDKLRLALVWLLTYEGECGKV